MLKAIKLAASTARTLPAPAYIGGTAAIGTVAYGIKKLFTSKEKETETDKEINQEDDEKLKKENQINQC